jgi:hypothetical protein
MILKVPIYVEIETIRTEDIGPFTEVLGLLMYKKLREEKSFNQSTFTRTGRDPKSLSKIRIISREEAIEHLRSSK